MNSSIKYIAITTGDPNGIGFEITAKALYKIGPQRNFLFFIFRDKKQSLKQKKYFQLLDKKFSRVTFTSFETALIFSRTLSVKKNKKQHILIDLSLDCSAAEWVVMATLACKYNILTSLVTGPLSKSLIKSSGFETIGHTGLFRSIFPKHKMHMAFVGKDFNVLLATDHLPLDQVKQHLKKNQLKQAYQAALNLKKLIRSNRPVGVLGLNPHAGEKGIIGNFEKTWPKNIPLALVPDAAFLKKNWTKYSVFLCLYHDQGLIPFKMHHGQDSGVHITIGLPFIRTSVDHGTAFDLYNKNKANSASMYEAIKLNLKMIGDKHV